MSCPGCEQLIPAWMMLIPLLPALYLTVRAKLRGVRWYYIAGALIILAVGILLVWLQISSISSVEIIPMPTPYVCPSCASS